MIIIYHTCSRRYSSSYVLLIGIACLSVGFFEKRISISEYINIVIVRNKLMHFARNRLQEQARFSIVLTKTSPRAYIVMRLRNQISRDRQTSVHKSIDMKICQNLSNILR